MIAPPALRKALQQLEAAGLIEKYQNRGRWITKEGRKLLEEIAEEVAKELSKKMPELEKYQKSG